jgi:hypothetical protein
LIQIERAKEQLGLTAIADLSVLTLPMQHTQNLEKKETLYLVNFRHHQQQDLDDSCEQSQFARMLKYQKRDDFVHVKLIESR